MSNAQIRAAFKNKEGFLIKVKIKYFREEN